MRIAVCDDENKFINDFMTKIYTLYNKLDIITDVYMSGQELLKVFCNNPYDIVFLDIEMPNMDGLQALKALKEKHSDAKVIMVSAMGQQVMVLDAIKNGALDFIVKPFDVNRVKEALNKAL